MFELIDHKISISPAMRNIPEFNALLKRDKTRGKLDAFCELCYVYYMCDYKSPYRNYPQSVREEKVKNDYASKRLGDKWKPDAKVLDAMMKYRELQETASVRFLQSVENSIDKLAAFLNETDPDEDTITAILNTIDKGAKLVPSIGKLKETVSKEVSEQSKIRGGGSTGFMEE